MAGRTERTGITLVQLFEMFPDEDAARTWFEAAIWPDGRACGRCGSVRTREASHAKMPYWCTDCRSYFSVKIGTVMQSSKLSLQRKQKTSLEPAAKLAMMVSNNHNPSPTR